MYFDNRMPRALHRDCSGPEANLGSATGLHLAFGACENDYKEIKISDA